MSNLFSTPLTTFYDTSGNLARKGKLFLYESGASTTHEKAFKDPDRQVAYEQPIQLDINGQAEIYLQDGKTYRLVLKSEDESTTYWTEDGLSAATISWGSPLRANSNLDMNGYTITSGSNENLDILPHGSGAVQLTNLTQTTNTSIGTNSITLDNQDTIIDGSGNEYIQFTGVASATNYLEFQPSDSSIDIEAVGTDSNINISLNPKGTGKTLFGGGNLAIAKTASIVNSANPAEIILDFLDTNSSPEGFLTSNSATGNPLIIGENSASGTGEVSLIPKGTGTVNVSGTTNYAANISDSDDIINVAFMESVLSLVNLEAAATVTYSGGTPSVSNGVNVTSIDDDDTGQYTLNLTSGITVDNCVSFAALLEALDENYVRTGIESTTTVHTEIWEISGGAAKSDSNTNTVIFSTNNSLV